MKILEKLLKWLFKEEKYLWCSHKSTYFHYWLCEEEERQVVVCDNCGRKLVKQHGEILYSLYHITGKKEDL